MAKIKLTESKLRQMIAESVKKVLNEFDDHRSNIASVYGGSDRTYDRYTSDIETAKANKEKYNQYATQKNIAARNAQNQLLANIEANKNRDLDAELVNSMQRNVINFYNTLKNYESKGMLGKFFSSRPNMNNYGINPGKLGKLNFIYRNKPELISTNLKMALDYFRKLGMLQK